MLLLTPALDAAPPFVLDGRYQELEALVLAEGPEGPVTALDVLFFLDHVRSPVAAIPVDQWLAEPDERDPQDWRWIREGVLQYLASLKLAREASPPPAPPFLQRSFVYAAAEAQWIDTTVRPEIEVEEVDINRYYIAHPELYSTPERAQVRYIHLSVPDIVELAAQREAEARLQEIRGRIAAREVTFEEAAQQYSDAPSKVRGGLIPEFTRGNFFTEFEYQAFSLDSPGEMSPVFAGNEGVYLIQLVSKEEARRVEIESVREEIRQTLQHEHIRSYYRLMGQKLFTETFSANYASLWNYASLDTPVAILKQTELDRSQLLRINPTIVNAAYDVQWSVLFDETTRWLEGEYILRDLEKRGLATGKYFDIAERVANAARAAQAALDARVSIETVATQEAAIKTLGGEGAGIPQSRVISISLLPDTDAIADIGRRDAVRDTMRQLSDYISRGELPTRPNPTEFSRTLAEAAGEGEEALAEAIADMRSALRASPWANVEVRLRDEGWKDSLPGLAWHPAIAGLRRGQMSGMQPIGESYNYFYIPAVRLAEDSPWVDSPLALRVAAYEILRLEQAEKVIEEVHKEYRLTFQVNTGSEE